MKTGGQGIREWIESIVGDFDTAVSGANTRNYGRFLTAIQIPPETPYRMIWKLLDEIDSCLLCIDPPSISPEASMSEQWPGAFDLMCISNYLYGAWLHGRSGKVFEEFEEGQLLSDLAVAIRGEVANPDLLRDLGYAGPDWENVYPIVSKLREAVRRKLPELTRTVTTNSDTLNTDSASNQTVQPVGQNRRRKRGRNRKHNCEPHVETEILAGWRSRRYKTKEDLASKLGHEIELVKAVIDRGRHSKKSKS